MKKILNISNLLNCLPSKVVMTSFVLAALFLGSAPAIGQTYYPVTAGSGTVSVGGVNVTVTPSGSVEPYDCGGVENGYYEDDGSYTFTFSSPVSAVRLYIAAIDNGDYGQDLITISINGTPYTVTNSQLTFFTPDCFSFAGPVGAVAVGGQITAPFPPGTPIYDYLETDAETILNIGGIGPINSFKIYSTGGGNGVVNSFAFAAGAPPPSTPTLSQWGLTIFSLLLLSFGMVFVYRRQNAMAFAGAMVEEKPSTFNRSLYIKALGAVLLIAVAGLVTTYRYFGSLTITDTLGTLASACVVAYMVQLSLLMKKK